MNLGEGMRRLALVLGLVGGLVGVAVGYIPAADIWRARRAHAFTLINAPQTDSHNPGGGSTSHDDPPKEGPTSLPPGYKLDSTANASDIQPVAQPIDPPSRSAYLLPLSFPLIGFVIPWLAIRAMGWVLIGFGSR